MIDTNTALQEASLLKDNKKELIKSLEGFGISAADDAPLSELAEKIKYADGCLQPRLAMYNADAVGESRYKYFTAQEWLAEPDEKDYKLLGLELRIEGSRFILSGKRAAYSLFNEVYYLNGLDVYDVGRDVAAISHSTGKEETNAILACLTANDVDINLLANKTKYAAIAAYQYEAFDGDPLKGKWYLPSAAEMGLILKYHTVIESAISLLSDDNHNRGRFGRNDLARLDSENWTSTSVTTGPNVNYGVVGHAVSGFLALAYKNRYSNVRPLAAIPTT